MIKNKEKTSLPFICILIVIISISLVFIYSKKQNIQTSTNSKTTIEWSGIPENNENIVGIWQASGSMAAGWSDRYHFYPNGTFHFYGSEMGCPSIVEKTGTYTYKEDTLKLSVISVTTGKDYNKTTEKCNKISTKNYSSPKLESYLISKITEKPSDIYPSIKIGKVQFWKFSDQADIYGDEQFPEK